MPSLFIGVYEALYPYTAQSDQELTVAQGDLLYVLEKSSEDDWWKVKKRVLGLETDEPTGLVPNNYIQPAPVVSKARALFEYDKQTEEEISFRENDVFDVYDSNDQDWILVGLNSEYGFVPSNYIEYTSTNAPSPAASEQPASQPTSLQAAAAFPTPISRVQQAQVEEEYEEEEEEAPPAQPPRPQQQQQHQPQLPRASSYENKPLPHPANDAYARPNIDRNDRYSDEEEALPPPKPARPTQSRMGSLLRRRTESPPQQPQRQDSNFFNWQVQEVVGRKKHKATLAVGNGMIMFSPEKQAPQQWDVSDLVNYSVEKKHVFLDFKNPTVNLDLHAGSKDNADDILSAIGEVAGANKAVGLREVYMAANSAGQQMGKVLYNFVAQGDDEVSAKEGENVFIIDKKQSDQWWMVRTASGQEGVIPSAYLELLNTDAKAALQKQKQQRSSSTSRSGRRKSLSKRDKGPNPPSKPKPDMSKIRTWTDRSGTFKVEAALLGCADGKIHLHKLNGVKIAVSANKMSVEDLEYVERVTGVTLDDDKPLVDVKRNTIRKPRGVPGGVSTGPPANGSRQNTNSPPAAAVSQQQQQTAPGSVPPAQSSSTKPEYDWFGFFLDCGVDVNNCQRYALNFNRDEMDESVLEDISPQVLRSLGLKEGDILRVTKKLDEKFERRAQHEQGGLFSQQGGVLKNNTSKEAVGQSSKESEKSTANGSAKTAANNHVNGFEDDAWAVKSEPGKKIPDEPVPPPKPQRPTTTGNAAPQQPQPTGALRDLLTMQPLQPVKTSTLTNGAPAPTASTQAPATTGGTSATALPPQLQQAQLSSQFQQPQQVFATGQVQPMYTGAVLVQQRTGPLQPVLTGGVLVQQRTGPLQPVVTGGGMQPLGPFATGNAQVLNPFMTGGNVSNIGPFVTGQVPQYTGSAQQVLGMGQPQQAFTGSTPTMNQMMQQQQQQPTGIFAQPFNQQQPTGIFAQPQLINQQQQQPTGIFAQQQQPTGIFAQQQQQQQQPYQQPQLSYSSPNINGMTAQFQKATLTGGGGGFNNAMAPQPQMNNMFGTQPQQNAFQQSNPFGFQPQTQFGMPQQQQQQQQQQPLQGQPTGFGFGNQPTSFPTAAQALGMDASSSYAPLQPQKTGPPPPVSFGNTPQPLQPTPTGRRANLAAATPNNPFGF